MTTPSPGPSLIVGEPIITGGTEGDLYGHGIVVENGEISRLVPLEEIGPLENFREVIGSNTHVVIPGMINGHYHSEAPLGNIYWQNAMEFHNCFWHQQFAVPITEEALYYSILSGLVECVRGGQTGIVDMFYGNPGLRRFGADAALQAYADVGLRVGFGLSVRDQNRYVHTSDEQFLGRLPSDLAAEVRETTIGYTWDSADVMATVEALAADWDGFEDRIRIIVAPDWTPCCSDALYRQCADLARELDTAITTHVLETRWEMAMNSEAYACSAVERLARLEVLGGRTNCVHFGWATDADIALVRDEGAIVTNNPGSNLRCGAGIARMRDYLEAGVKVAIGTDANSISWSEDFLQEVRLAMLLQRRPVAIDAGAIPGSMLLSSITKAAPAALAQDGRVGTLEPGSAADCLVLRKDRLFQPHALYDSWEAIDVVFERATAADIEQVVVGGRTICRDGAVVTVNEQQVSDAYCREVERRSAALASEPDLRREFVELPQQLEPWVVRFYKEELAKPYSPAYAYNTDFGPADQ